MSEFGNNSRTRSHSLEDSVFLMTNETKPEPLRFQEPVRTPSISEDTTDDLSCSAREDISLKLAQARSYKEEGNARYKEGTYSAAIGKYHRALIYLKAVDATQKLPFGNMMGQKTKSLPVDMRREVDQLLIDCYSNLAACMLQSESPAYSRILECCNDAIAISPVNNVKVLYRKGIALYHLKRVDEAADVLKMASKLQTKPDSNLSRYLALCNRELAVQEQKLKEQYKAMFKKTTADASKTPADASKTPADASKPPDI